MQGYVTKDPQTARERDESRAIRAAIAGSDDAVAAAVVDSIAAVVDSIVNRILAIRARSRNTPSAIATNDTATAATGRSSADGRSSANDAADAEGEA